MNFFSGSLRGQTQQNNQSRSPIGAGTNGLSSRSNLLRSSPAGSRRPSQDLMSSTSTLGDTVSNMSDQFSHGARPPARRLSRRSISRHPPTGTIESAINVLDILHGILGDLPPSSKQEIASETGETESDFSFLDKALEEPIPANVETIEELAQLEEVASETKKQEFNHNDPDLDNFDEKMAEYEALRDTVGKSDRQLEGLQVYLASFQKDLDTLSADMENLENRSRQISRKLDVRQGVEKKLAPIVEALIIPPMIVRQIADGEISLQWRSALKYVMQRQSELSLLKERGNFSAIKGAEDQLKLVTHKAIERIRDFIVTRIKSLRVAGVNAQAIQKELLDYRELYAFILQAHPDLGRDLLQAYINTMAWYYSNYFQRYMRSLEKLNINRVDRSVLLGSDDSSRRGLLFYNRAAPTAMKAMDSLSLGNRALIIASDDPSVMLAQIAETNNMTYWMEIGFRSFNLALIDNAAVEYQFLTDFFQLKNGEEATKSFNKIFDRTFQHGQDYTKFLLEDSFDAYGILICIRICRKLEFELQHRRVPVVESYLNLQLINLWPRFQLVMDAHCDSLRRSTSRASIHTFGGQDSGSGSAGKASSTAALVPHQITQIFSSFVAGILSLCEDDSESEPVANSLVRLRNEFESLLTKISASFGTNKTGGSSKREKFLYNNYFLVSTILSDVNGKLAELEKDHFRLLTEAYDAKQ